MDEGTIVEVASTREFFENPQSSRSRALLDAWRGGADLVRFLAQRLTHALFVLFCVSVLTFAFVRLAPGDYLEEMRMNPQISTGTVAALRQAYGLDRSLPVTYLLWARSVLHGDLGFSFAYNVPVWPLLKVRAGNTLLLTVTALICSWLLAIPLGVWAAATPGNWGGQGLRCRERPLTGHSRCSYRSGLAGARLANRLVPHRGMHSLAAGGNGESRQIASILILHLALPVLASGRWDAAGPDPACAGRPCSRYWIRRTSRRRAATASRARGSSFVTPCPPRPIP